MRTVESFDVIIAVARKAQLDLIRPVDGNVCGTLARRGYRMAAREAVLLRKIWRNDDRLAPGRAYRTPDSEPADLLRCGQIPLQQRRRQIPERYVIESGPVSSLGSSDETSTSTPSRSRIAFRSNESGGGMSPCDLDSAVPGRGWKLANSRLRHTPPPTAVAFRAAAYVDDAAS